MRRKPTVTYEQVYRKALARFENAMIRYKTKDGAEYDIRIGSIINGKFKVAVVAQSLADAYSQMDRQMFWQHEEEL